MALQFTNVGKWHYNLQMYRKWHYNLQPCRKWHYNLQLYRKWHYNLQLYRKWHYNLQLYRRTARHSESKEGLAKVHALCNGVHHVTNSVYPLTGRDIATKLSTGPQNKQPFLWTSISVINFVIRTFFKFQLCDIGGACGTHCWEMRAGFQWTKPEGKRPDLAADKRIILKWT